MATESFSLADMTGIERVKHFKLLGINIFHDFRWQTHVDVITSKLATRLYFLRILKKSGLNQQHLLHFYLSVIRPVLEYCSVVWHHSLSTTCCAAVMSYEDQQIAHEMQRRQHCKDITSTSTAQSSQHVCTVCGR